MNGVTMELTTFRSELTATVDRLDETGPVRLTKYNDTVAEIRSATPEGDRQYAARILNAFFYLEEKCSVGVTGLLVNAGVDTLEALIELVNRHKALVDQGVTFDPYPEHTLPESGALTVDEALARMYFGDNHPNSTGDPYAWFEACTQLQAEAARRGLETELPYPNAYDEDEPTFVEMAVSSGHTPQSLVQFGVTALDQGVPLKSLADLLGEDAVPADVVAMKEYDEYWFNELTKEGLPHGEAVTLYRAGRGDRIRDVITLVNAGVRTAEEIGELLDSKISLPLVTRAHADGLTPEQWREQVPMVQHHKYEESGNLPFSLLVEAAKEKVSLVRWDKSTLPIEGENARRSFYASREDRQGMYPWVHVYPHRVLDLARAGISPSFLVAFGKLMKKAFENADTLEDFSETAIQAHGLGLTADMANAMSRLDSKRPVFTPAQLISVLEEGLSSTGQAHYLADRYADPGQWVKDLRERREGQLMTDTFVATVEHTEAWRAVKDAAQEMQGLIKARAFHGEIYLKEIVGKFLSGKPLNDCELMILLSHTAHAFGDRSYLPRRWREKHEGQADAVRQLAKSFDRTHRPARSN
ncbi:hypothetical protein ACFW2V_12255 [Streptomyces sp. NPDC058947]|uniref:hypothetical protein n=1 Tax=Streptomyces sp. NPDC058947 TaxID=3346675 RepID=UPI0036B9C491